MRLVYIYLVIYDTQINIMQVNMPSYMDAMAVVLLDFSGARSIRVKLCSFKFHIAGDLSC